MKLNESNIILVVGDLGAGSNLVKNILLTSTDVDWIQPSQDRVNYILTNIYPASLKNNLANWLTHEYKLRNWKRVYNTDPTDEFNDIATDIIIHRSQHKKIVLMTHWPAIANKLKSMYPKINIISLYPETQFELLWQIKTYIDKVGIEKLQNFSFNDTNEKNIYIDNFGLDAYYKFNVLNMFEILHNRINDYKNLPGYKIAIGKLTEGAWIPQVSNLLNINLDIAKAQNIVNTWNNLHYPITEVTASPWLELIKNSEIYDNTTL